ncbi:MAG: DnaA regulatory inactivator Hda [Burkholderiales bacterium]|nr:DnaA regulatory inactivator Hda [Burkholderiales bacterium]
MPQQLILEWTREVAPAFDNFLAGSNGEVLAHLRSLVAGDLRSASVLIWGAPGSGKSHLLAAALAAARARKRSAAAAHVEQDQPPAAAPGALYAIDDVDTLSAGGQGRLFTFYNTCRDAGAQLLLSARVPAAQAPLRDDLRTRLGSGLVLELRPLGDADKPAALAAYAREQGFHLAPEVVDFLLTRGRRDMGALLSTLRALDRYSLSTKRPVTIPLVKELLQPDLLQAADDAAANRR